MARLLIRSCFGLLIAACVVGLTACQPSTPSPVFLSPTAMATTAAAPLPAGTSPPSISPAAATLAPSAAATRVLTATPAMAAPSSTSLFVYTSADGSLSLHDPNTKAVKVLLQATSKEFFDGPAFSRDGSRVVYVYTIFDNAGKLTNEVRSVGIDGGDVRTLFKAPAAGPAIYFGYPRYTPDGASLTFSVVTEGSTPRDNLYRIVRGPAAGGEWTVILDNGYEPSFTADSKQVTFLRLDPQTFYTSLWIANANGAAAQKLVAEDIFMEVAGPHFTPDGQAIVFAASGPPSKKLPTASLPMARAQPADDCALRVLFACLVWRAHANGLPWDLWQVSADGKKFKQLTDLQLDSPWPAIARDGKSVAYMTFEGTYVVDRQTGKVSRLSNEGGHGVIDWYQR